MPVSLPDRMAGSVQFRRQVEVEAVPPISLSRDVEENEVETNNGSVVVMLPGRVRRIVRKVTGKAKDAQTGSTAHKAPKKGPTNAVTKWTAPWKS